MLCVASNKENEITLIKAQFMGLALVMTILLCGCASVKLFEDRKTGSVTELSLKGPEAAIAHKF